MQFQRCDLSATSPEIGKGEADALRQPAIFVTHTAGHPSPRPSPSRGEGEGSLIYWNLRGGEALHGSESWRGCGRDVTGPTRVLVTVRAGSPWKRRARSALRSRRSACAVSSGCSPAACEPSTKRSGAGCRSTVSMMRAAILAGSPGAGALLGSSIRRKPCAGVSS